MTTPEDARAEAPLRERVGYWLQCFRYGQPLMGVDWTQRHNERVLEEADELIEMISRAAQGTSPADALVALDRLYRETADYITINNLGRVHHNMAMQMARDALLNAGYAAISEPQAQASSSASGGEAPKSDGNPTVGEQLVGAATVNSGAREALPSSDDARLRAIAEALRDIIMAHDRWLHRDMEEEGSIYATEAELSRIVDEHRHLLASRPDAGAPEAPDTRLARTVKQRNISVQGNYGEGFIAGWWAALEAPEGAAAPKRKPIFKPLYGPGESDESQADAFEREGAVARLREAMRAVFVDWYGNGAIKRGEIALPGNYERLIADMAGAALAEIGRHV